MADKEKMVTVTPDGRTLVDANQLFEKEEVKKLVEAVRKIYYAEVPPPRMRGPRRGRYGRLIGRTV